jgi:hypothetical protein
MTLLDSMRGWFGAQTSSDTTHPSQTSAAPPSSPVLLQRFGAQTSSGTTHPSQTTAEPPSSPVLLQHLPPPKPFVGEDTCSDDEENMLGGYQELLQKARLAVETGAEDATQWVRAAQAATAAVGITTGDGTEVFVSPTHSGFYVSWRHTMDPPPTEKKGATASRRGANFRKPHKVRKLSVTITQGLADDISKGFFGALLTQGARCAARSEAALSLTALALQPVYAMFLQASLEASPLALHTADTATMIEVLRSRMHASFSEFAGGDRFLGHFNPLRSLYWAHCPLLYVSVVVLSAPMSRAGTVAHTSTPIHGIATATTATTRRSPPHASSNAAQTAVWDDEEACELGDDTEGGDGSGDSDGGGGGGDCPSKFSVYERMSDRATSVDLFMSKDALGAIASGVATDGGRIRRILLTHKMSECTVEARRRCSKRGASVPDMQPYLEALRQGDSQQDRALRITRLVCAGGRATAQLAAWQWPTGVVFVGTPGSLCLTLSPNGNVQECPVEHVAVAVACKVACVGALNETTMRSEAWRANVQWLQAGGSEGATCLAVRVQVCKRAGSTGLNNPPCPHTLARTPTTLS